MPKAASFLESLSEAKTEEKAINVLILTSRKDESNDTILFRTAQRIVEICKQRKLGCYVAFAETCFIRINEDSSRSIHNYDDEKGFKVSPYNTVAIIRGSVGRSNSTKDLISQLERSSIFCVNSRSCLEVCGDKYRTVLALADANVICPKTALVQNRGNIEHALEIIGNEYPIILKTLSGSKGVGVFYAESWKSFKPVLDTIWKINEDEEILIQQFIKAEYDIRVHVIGGEIVASMKRDIIPNDFRSNFSLGGKVGPIKLSKDQEEICRKAADAVGGIWVGVDLIEDKKGNTYVLEVNSSPGTEGIEKATKEDIVSILLDHASERKNWVKVAKESGYLETVRLEEIGDVVAKFDTGNGSYSVLHADNLKVEGKKVTWSTNGVKLTKPLIDTRKALVGGGGIMDYTEDRPIVELGVKFDNLDSTAQFVLGRRTDRSTSVLLNRYFMKRAHVVVNPAKTFLLSQDPNQKM